MLEQQHQQPANAERQGGAAHEEQQQQPERVQRSAAGAGVPPDLLSGGGVLALQRSLGNRAVQALVQRRSRPTIQREIYIERAKLSPARLSSSHYKLTESELQEGTGARNVQNMLSDTPKRYFNSKAEMRSFANQQTDNIGFLKSKKHSAWIRLPTTFTVVGEDHDSTTLPDMVKATGTDKFMYEPYTEKPEGIAPGGALDTDMKAREQTINNKMGKAPAPGDKSHYAESFFPKAMRALTGIKLNNHKILGSEIEAKLLRMALLAAAEIDATDPTAFPTYHANKVLFDTTAAELQAATPAETSLTQSMERAKSDDLYTQFVGDFDAYTDLKVQAERGRASAKDRTAFDTNWHRAEGNDYDVDGSPIMKAEKNRDFSMYQHIKKAKASGYLLFGLGDLHRLRLKDLLAAEGIPHMHMDDYIAQQKAAHPQ